MVWPASFLDIVIRLASYVGVLYIWVWASYLKGKLWRLVGIPHSAPHDAKRRIRYDHWLGELAVRKIGGQLLTSEADGSATRFFALTYVLSWTVWLPLMFAHLGVLDLGLPEAALTPLALPGVLMPSVAALITASRRPTKDGVRQLLGRLLIWRIGWWWAPILLMQPLVLVLTVALSNTLGWGEPIYPTYPASFGTLLIPLAFLLIAATGEEIGWRGYALPVLQARHSPLLSSAIVGVAAATWHLPYWVLQGTLGTYGVGYFALNYVFILAITIQITWLYNRTRSSVLVPVVFHVVFNVVNVALLPVTSSVPAFALLTIFEWALALTLIGRLGSQPHASTSRFIT
jgi:membrane protease YdiL (CAAX protease family)